MIDKPVNTDTQRSASPHSSSMTRVRPGTVVAALLVTTVAAVVIFWNLAGETYFMDESAMIGQSYYYRLFTSGQWNHSDWLHYAAYDHPPLPKYLFGLSLDVAGLAPPTSLGPWLAWIQGDYTPPADGRMLFWARVPAALFGVGGVLAVYFIGLHVRGRILGVMASLLLVVNPLYLTHARRAMPDSFAECLVISSVAIALWGLKQVAAPRVRPGRWLAFVAAASVTCGLAALAKLNGGLASIVVVGMVSITWVAAATRRVAARSCTAVDRPHLGNLAITPVAGVSVAIGSFLVFLALNPFLTARPTVTADLPASQRELLDMKPIERARYLVEFRRQWSREALENPGMSADWLPSLGERARMTLLEGFGRYSVFGPREIPSAKWWPQYRASLESAPNGVANGKLPPAAQHSPADCNRLDQHRRRACLIWFPLFLLGVCWSFCDGWMAIRRGASPLTWCLFAYAATAVASVVLLIPLNWDRYYLPLEACASLLVPLGVIRTLATIGAGFVLKPDPPRLVTLTDSPQ